MLALSGIFGLRLRAAVGLTSLLCAALLSGCGSGRDLPLADIGGRVTLNGQPLADALVEFQPEKGSPSYGQTDAKGRYELRFSRRHAGAMIGQHKVRIRTERPTTDNNGNEISRREIVPAHYNAQTTLTARVEPSSDEINFDLSTDQRVATQAR